MEGGGPGLTSGREGHGAPSLPVEFPLGRKLDSPRLDLPLLFPICLYPSGRYRPPLRRLDFPGPAGRRRSHSFRLHLLLFGAVRLSVVGLSVRSGTISIFPPGVPFSAGVKLGKEEEMGKIPHWRGLTGPGGGCSAEFS